MNTNYTVIYTAADSNEEKTKECSYKEAISHAQMIIEDGGQAEVISSIGVFVDVFGNNLT